MIRRILAAAALIIGFTTPAFAATTTGVDPYPYHIKLQSGNCRAEFDWLTSDKAMLKMVSSTGTCRMISLKVYGKPDTGCTCGPVPSGGNGPTVRKTWPLAFTSITSSVTRKGWSANMAYVQLQDTSLDDWLIDIYGNVY